MSAFSHGYSYYIIGILRNISNQNQSGIQVVVQMFDAKNNLINLETGFPVFTELSPNETTPFKVMSLTNDPKFDHYLVTLGARN